VVSAEPTGGHKSRIEKTGPAGYTPAMIQGIVFDFDGVIVDTEPLHYRAFLAVLEPLGVRFDYETYVRRYIGFDDRDGVRAMAEEYGLELDDRELVGLIDAKTEAFERIVGEGVRAFAGVVELVEESAARMPIAICSGAVRSDIEAILPAIGGGGLADRFGAIVTADDVTQSKPDPQSYRLATERLGLPPAACLAIEDTPPGLASARGAGLRTLGVANSYPLTTLNDADRAVESLEGVTVDRLQAWFD